MINTRDRKVTHNVANISSVDQILDFIIICDCEIKDGGHRVPPAGLPIEQVLGEYSLSFLRRDVALFVSTRARDSF